MCVDPLAFLAEGFQVGRTQGVPGVYVMAKASMAEELALVLVRRVYEATDGTFKQVRLVMRTGLTKAALEFAIDSGWVVVEGEHDVSLTDRGRAVVRKDFS
jgi:hypothetical protein